MKRSDEPRTGHHRSDTGDPPRRKKPYVKPSFTREGVFETTALACGKIGNSSSTCILVRKSS